MGVCVCRWMVVIANGRKLLVKGVAIVDEWIAISWPWCSLVLGLE